jgi:hypothetical protein
MCAERPSATERLAAVLDALQQEREERDEKDGAIPSAPAATDKTSVARWEPMRASRQLREGARALGCAALTWDA